jgi:hypothetical protein
METVPGVKVARVNSAGVQVVTVLVKETTDPGVDGVITEVLGAQCFVIAEWWELTTFSGIAVVDRTVVAITTDEGFVGAGSGDGVANVYCAHVLVVTLRLKNTSLCDMARVFGAVIAVIAYDVGVVAVAGYDITGLIGAGIAVVTV